MDPVKLTAFMQSAANSASLISLPCPVTVPKTGRQACVVGYAREFEDDERSYCRWLEYHGVACQQDRTEIACRREERVVQGVMSRTKPSGSWITRA